MDAAGLLYTVRATVYYVRKSPCVLGAFRKWQLLAALFCSVTLVIWAVLTVECGFYFSWDHALTATTATVFLLPAAPNPAVYDGIVQPGSKATTGAECFPRSGSDPDPLRQVREFHEILSHG